jgi:hypothetical protein
MLRFALLPCLFFSAAIPLWALPEAEIQRFIDEAIQAGGGEVVIPPGVHVIEKGLRLAEAKKLRLIGLDAEECVLKGGKDTTEILRLGGGCESVFIEKLTFEGGKHAITESDGAKPSSKILIGRCFFQNQAAAAVSLPKAEIESLEIDQCSFRDIAGAGVLFGGQVSSSQITHNHFTRCQTGVALDGPQKCLVASNELSDCGTGVRVSASSKKPTDEQGNIVALNSIDRSTENGIEIGKGTRSNSVIQNEIAASGGDGLRLSGDRHTVQRNQISKSGGKNIAVIEGEHQIAE